jgi:hypothetical protein
VHPGRVVAERGLFFVTLGGPKALIPLSKNTSKKGAPEPQVPPLRCAPVGMTRGEVALPERDVAGQDPFFIASGSCGHDTELSSRLEGSVVEGPAVFSPGARAAFEGANCYFPRSSNLAF